MHNNQTASNNTGGFDDYDNSDEEYEFNSNNRVARGTKANNNSSNSNTNSTAKRPRKKRKPISCSECRKAHSGCDAFVNNCVVV